MATPEQAHRWFHRACYPHSLIFTCFSLAFPSHRRHRLGRALGLLGTGLPKELDGDAGISANSGRYGGAAAMSGGSFNSNFNTHRREWAVMMKAQDRPGGEGGGSDRGGDRGGGGAFDGTCNICGKTGHRARDCPGGGSGGGGGGGGGGGQAGGGKGGGKGGGGFSTSSDDRCFEQYKKRARR